jgi:hypothetical protein
MATSSSGPQSSRARRTRWLLILVGLLVVLAIVGLVALVWYIFLRPAGPPPLGPGAPVIPQGSLSGALALLADAIAA